MRDDRRVRFRRPEGIGRLDTNVFDCVLQKLGASDLLACGKVSWAWRQAVDSSSRWEHLAASEQLQRDDSMSAKQVVRRALFSKINVRRGCFFERVLREPKTGIDKPLREVDDSFLHWSPDNRYLAAYWHELTLCIFDTTKGVAVFERPFNADSTNPVGRNFLSASWNTASTRLVCAEDGGDIFIFDAPTQTHVNLQGADDDVIELHWLINQNKLMAIGNNGVGLLVDLTENFHRPKVSRISVSAGDQGVDLWNSWVSPDMTVRAVLAQNLTLSFQEVETGKRMSTIDLSKECDESENLRWSPNSRRLAVNLGDFSFMVANRENFQASPIRRYTVPAATSEAQIQNFSWSHNGSKLAISSGSYVNIFDPAKEQFLISIKHVDRCSAMQWDPTSRYLFTSSDIDTVRGTDTITGRTVVDIRGPRRWSNEGGFSPGAEQLTIKSRSAGIYNITPGTQETILLARTADVYTFDWSPDRTRLAVVRQDATISILDFRFLALPER